MKKQVMTLEIYRGGFEARVIPTDKVSTLSRKKSGMCSRLDLVEDVDANNTHDKLVETFYADPYINGDVVLFRLVNEWLMYGDKFVICYDFDDTVHDFHKLGRTYDRVMTLLRRCKDIGAYFIVSTNCDESKLPGIKQYLDDNNLPYDIFNDNAPHIPFKSRKIYANILLDDRAGLESAVVALELACSYMEER